MNMYRPGPVSDEAARILLLAFGVIACLLAADTHAASAVTSGFDHLSTGYDLLGSHREAPCEGCHLQGVFKGTPKRCVACHTQASRFPADKKPVNHIRTTDTCDDCHNSTTWKVVNRIDHAAVIGSCFSCHNGNVAQGKHAAHIASGNACDDCHTTTSWSSAVFDHGSITGNCFSCHNGRTATGKSPRHIQTTNSCENCHRTTAWEPVIRVDHADVLGSCFSCHNGTVAQGKSPNHIASGNTCDDCHTTTAWTPAVFDHNNVSPGTCTSCHNGVTAGGKPANHITTSAQCDACHTTRAWLPATFDHNNVTGSCSSCHNGTQATGKPAGHFVTSIQCDICHDTTRWIPLIFRHSSPGYPGDHRRNLLCTDCHQSNSQAVPWRNPAYQPDCAACHANDFKPGPHKKHENPDATYSVGELKDCSGSCHIYTNSSMTTIKERRDSRHRVNDSNF